MAVRSANSDAQRGAIYLFLLFLVATTSVAGAVAFKSWTTEMQREREAELLAIGNAFRAAVASYYEASPAAAKSYPPSLDALLRDPRFPNVRRHLRQIYPDPMTGRADWVPIAAPAGGLAGVASRSEEVPLKRAGFDDANRAFADLGRDPARPPRYRDWEFVFVPGGATP